MTEIKKIINGDLLSTGLNQLWRIISGPYKEVLYGAMSEQTQNAYYAKEMRCLRQEGFKNFLHGMEKSCIIYFYKKAIYIDVKHKYIEVTDGTKSY